MRSAKRHHLLAWRRLLQEKREEIKRLEEELAADRAVCLCSCPPDSHESYGEDGESCEDETHECLRVSVAVRDAFAGLRADLKRTETRLAIAQEAEARWRTCPESE